MPRKTVPLAIGSMNIFSFIEKIVDNDNTDTWLSYQATVNRSSKPLRELRSDTRESISELQDLIISRFSSR